MSPAWPAIGASLAPNGNKSARTLGEAKEVPAYQRRRFIVKYYRLGPPRCRHFWCCHNEWGNMWTHILAGAYMLVRLTAWLSSFQADRPQLAQSRALYMAGVGLYFVVSLGVFCVSVSYHWKRCAAEHEFRRWLCLDQYSCLVLVVAGYLAGILVGFHCHAGLQRGYLAMLLALCAAMLALMTLRPAATEQRGAYTSLVIIGGGLIGIIPCVHWLVISREGRRAAGARLVLTMVVGIASVAILTRCFPECCAPGRFDLVGSSHQIWHALIFVVITTYGDILEDVFLLTGSQHYCA